MRHFCLLLFLFLFSLGYADQQSGSNQLPTPTIVVTCASGEIGGVIAKKLAGENNLILTGRNRITLKELQNELKSQYSGEYETFVVDYCDSASIFDFEKALAERNTEISGFVLITPRPQFSSDLLQSDSNWTKLFQSTFIGPLEILKKTLSYLTSPGKIVIIGGTTSVQLLSDYGPTCVVRRMWTTYAKALAHQLGPKGIHVNVLSPGVVLTNFHTERIAGIASRNAVEYNVQLKEDTAKIPLRRHALPEEIAQATEFLLSNNSNYHHWGKLSN